MAGATCSLHRGFTLVEVLVALAMTGMLVSLLMSSLYYGTRVQASLADELQLREESLRRVDWFAQSLRGCMPVAKDTEVQFQGSDTEVHCFSVSPLQARSIPSPQRIVWALRKSPTNPRLVDLVYKDLDDEKSAELVVQRFDGFDLRFVYKGVDGSEVFRWPPSATSPETLPRWVQLSVREGKFDRTEWVAAMQADPWLEEEIKLPFGMELPR